MTTSCASPHKWVFDKSHAHNQPEELKENNAPPETGSLPQYAQVKVSINMEQQKVVTIQTHRHTHTRRGQMLRVTPVRQAQRRGKLKSQNFVKLLTVTLRG